MTKLVAFKDAELESTIWVNPEHAVAVCEILDEAGDLITVITLSTGTIVTTKQSLLEVVGSVTGGV